MGIDDLDTGELRSSVEKFAKKQAQQKQGPKEFEANRNPLPAESSSQIQKPAESQPSPQGEDLSKPAASTPPEKSTPQPPTETAPPPPLEESRVEESAPTPASKEPEAPQSPSTGEKFKSVLEKAQKAEKKLDLKEDADSFNLSTIDVLLSQVDKQELTDPDQAEELAYVLVTQEILKLKGQAGHEYGQYFLKFIQNQLDQGKYKISKELASDFSPAAKEKKDNNPVLWLFNAKRKELLKEKKQAGSQQEKDYYASVIDKYETFVRTLILE